MKFWFSPARQYDRKRAVVSLFLIAVALGSAVACTRAGQDRAKAAAERVLPALRSDLAKERLAVGDPVFLRIFKAERVLELWMRGQAGADYRLFRTYPIVAMSGELGPKLREGDRQAPEGFYDVHRDQMNPRSSYHLAFNLGYPNEYDRSHDRTGSFLMVHGSNVSIGCFAMTDEKIEEIYTLVDAALTAGQESFAVHIFPFRMTAQRMREARDHRWFDFWNELRPGYQYFEDRRAPPGIVVRARRYSIAPAI